MQQQRNNKNRMQRNNNNNNKHRHGRNNHGQQNRGQNQQNRPRININQATNQRDKFLNQARDALHNGDRVLNEYYLQHADHYQRLINEYNDEQEARRQQMAETQTESADQDADTEESGAASEMMQDGETDENAGSIAAILPAAIPLDTDDLEPKIANS